MSELSIIAQGVRRPSSVFGRPWCFVRSRRRHRRLRRPRPSPVFLRPSSVVARRTSVLVVVVVVAADTAAGVVDDLSRLFP